MKVESTHIPDVKLITPQVFGDERGFFMEVWNHNTYEKLGLPTHFVQDNHSKSSRNTLRGLHYQLQHPQGKLVRVTQGSVYDVAVDMRKTSPTFGQWVGMTLSAENKIMAWIPEGFAHGFYVTSDTAEFQYKCTDIYAPTGERTLMWNDPSLKIDWPIPENTSPLISEKDAIGSAFDHADFYA